MKKSLLTEMWDRFNADSDKIAKKLHRKMAKQAKERDIENTRRAALTKQERINEDVGGAIGSALVIGCELLFSKKKRY